MNPASSTSSPKRAAVSVFKEIFFWATIGLIIDWAFLSIKDSTAICDEGWHLQQTSWFLEGNYHVTKAIPMLPTYHAILAVIFHLLGDKTLAELRLISFLGSAMSIWVFHLLVRRLWPEEIYIRTVQYVCFPLLFPFFFLIYTDAWSLLFVLIAVERALARQIMVCSIAIGMAILIRQTNVFWAVFVWLLFLDTIPSAHNRATATLKLWLVKTWPFIFIFMVFGICVLTNGVVANGRTTHQGLTLNLANVWFFFLLLPFLFLPNTIGVLRRNVHWLSPQRKWVVSTILVGAVVFWLTYRISHQYNQPGLWFYLRNRLLFCTTHYPVLKFGAGILVCLGAFMFLRTPLADRRGWSLALISIASIVVLPVIEPRYYLIPMILFLAFRKSESFTWESLQTILYVIASFLIFEGTVFHWYFL